MSTSPRTSRKPKPAEAFHVRFWGVRGSIPSPGPTTSRYGGNTSCVEVRCGEELFIFDMGSGARRLGESLLRPLRATVFLSHYHWDHLQGLPFFAPVYDAKSELTVYGPTRNGQAVREIIAGQMQEPYFPVAADAAFRAKVEYRPFEEGDEVRRGDAVVSALELRHPGGNLGYRVDFRDRSVVYATDVEAGDADGRLLELAHDADVLIFDAMYTDDEYAGKVGPPRAGWGHSTWRMAVAAAKKSRAKKLVLFHHEPTRGDREMDRLVREARRHYSGVVGARESLVIRV